MNLAFYFLGFHYNAQAQNVLKYQTSSFDIFKMKHFNIALKTFVSFVSTQTICQIVSTTLNLLSAIIVTLISPHSLALPFKWLSHSPTDTRLNFCSVLFQMVILRTRLPVICNATACLVNTNPVNAQESLWCLEGSRICNILLIEQDSFYY